LSSRQSLLERVLIETRSSLDTIKGLSASTSEEVLVPVGGGILLRASPPKTDKVLLNIGANVVVERTKDVATKFMDARAGDLEENITAIASQRNQIAQRLESDQRALQSLLSRQGQ
jgi:prefoldin alpha subunit